MKNLVDSIQINSEDYNLIPYTATFNAGGGNLNYKKICSWKLTDNSHWENDCFCYYCKARHSTTGLYMIDYGFFGNAGNPAITIRCFMSSKYEYPQVFKWNQETSSIEMYAVTWDWNAFGITLLGNCVAYGSSEFIIGETSGQEYASIEELPGTTIEVAYAIMDSNISVTDTTLKIL